jgi:tRNA threonylcarbamoyl adenosine modification protein YeaZ
VIVAIDTSSSLTSVAAVDGDWVVERSHEDARRHAEVLAPLLAEVVAAIDVAGVRVVACGVGPGPYTGLRVGIAAAIALGLAWDVPVVGLCSLDAIAAQRRDGGSVGDDLLVASDARRREAYWARYDPAGERIDGPRVSPTADVPAPLDQPHAEWVARCVARHLAGGAAEAVALDLPLDLPLDRHGDDSGATAAALAGVGLLAPRPLYLRRPDVTMAAP